MLTKKEIKSRAQIKALGDYLSDWNENKTFNQLIKIMQNDWFDNKHYTPAEAYELNGGNWIAEEIMNAYRVEFYNLSQIAKTQKTIANALNDAENLIEILGNDKRTKSALNKIQKAFDALGSL